MDTKDCLQCGKTFARPKKMSAYLWDRRKFCSRTCWTESKKVTNKDSKQCSACGKIFFSKGTSTKCKSCKVNEKRYNIKLKAIAHKGGSCCKCGYNKCIAALQFHHTNPLEKDFKIGGSHTYSWERIQKELDKCILVCANCHAELHYKESKRET